MLQKLHLALCCSGILVALVLYSILQERIMTQPFGEQGGYFRWTLLLVLCNRMVTASFAALALVIQQQSLSPAIPVYKCLAVSLSNVVATSCQYEALKHVSFPVQTLAKCAKMVPVMIWGTLISGKRYSVRDYGVAAVIALGCFSFASNGRSMVQQRQVSSLQGLALMLGYLAFDGFTSTFQDKLFKGHSMSLANQMLYVNVCSAMLSLLGLVSGGQLVTSVAFVSHHPEALGSMLLLSAAASTGQLLIMHTIKTFGALVFATIMTTRQFVSVLVSCAMFAHPMSAGQWGGTFAVIGALYCSAFLKSSSKSGRNKDKKKRV